MMCVNEMQEPEHKVENDSLSGRKIGKAKASRRSPPNLTLRQLRRGSRARYALQIHRYSKPVAEAGGSPWRYGPVLQGKLV